MSQESDGLSVLRVDNIVREEIAATLKTLRNLRTACEMIVKDAGDEALRLQSHVTAMEQQTILHAVFRAREALAHVNKAIEDLMRREQSLFVEQRY